MRWYTWRYPMSAPCPCTATIVVQVGPVGDGIPNPTCTQFHMSSPSTNSMRPASGMIAIVPMEDVHPRVIVNSEMQLFLLQPLSPDFEQRLCS